MSKSNDEKLEEFTGDNGTLGTDNLEELLKRAAEIEKRKRDIQKLPDDISKKSSQRAVDE